MKKNNKNTPRKTVISYLMLITLFVILLSSCEHPKISTMKTPDEYFARKGDSLEINWHFNNADAVYVSGFEQEFDPIDKVTVFADYSKAFTVKAYQGNVDS